MRAHDERTTTVAARLDAPELADLPAERPPTDHLDAAVAAAEHLRDATVAAAEAWTSAAAAVSGWAEEHRTATAGAVDLRDRAARLRRVAVTVCGQTGTRVSLSRWVLAAYLADICALANQRLDGMTGGRYRLRVLPEGGHANRRGGLDLRVLDAHTGEERKVSTLSGGETFQASLALALAVADAVQHHAGGLRMEALFIDEGFGSLDPDALELAMDTLDQLRAGGRSVGVISHVASMRERIRTGIEVVPSEDGSTVRVGAVNA
jgi:exonuclease SbcC